MVATNLIKTSKNYGAQSYEYYKSFLDNLDNTRMDAEILMDKMEQTSFDPLLLKVIEDDCLIHPIFILSTNKEQDSKLILLKSTYLVNQGLEELTRYYKDEYSGFNNDFDIFHHTELITCMCIRMTRGDLYSFNTTDYQEWWRYILNSLTEVVSDLANNVTDLKPETLAPIMLLHYIMDQINLDINSKLKDSVYIISNYIYGEPADKIITIGRSLDLSKDVNFWISNIPESSDLTIELPQYI